MTIRFAGVVDEEPFDPHTWSGSSVFFFGALERRGSLARAVAATPSLLVRRVYQAKSFQPNRRSWRFRYHLNLGYYARMTDVARRRLSNLAPADYDAILQIGAWYDLTDPRGKPVVSYHDGNLATLLKSPYGHPRLPQRHIDATLRYERGLYNRIRILFPMSRWLADSFIRDNGVPPSRVFPVGAGINLPKTRRIVDKRYDAPRILFIGKDFQRKGGADLLRAFQIVRRSIPDAELSIVGPTLPEPPPGVRSVGYLSKSDPHHLERLLDEFERASVFVMPSLYEPFGIVFAEAMAHMLPCIGTNICAMPEIIDDGESGFVVPPRDSEALARRILDLLSDPKACAEFGARGHRKYEARFTWQAVTDQLCEVSAAELRI